MIRDSLTEKLNSVFILLKENAYATQHRSTPYQRSQGAGGRNQEAAPPVVITQNGEAKAVLMGIHEYERMQETLVMLKVLSLSCKSFEAGKGRPTRGIFADLRGKAE